MASATVPRKLWEHPDPKSTAMYKFMQQVNRKHGLNLKASKQPQKPFGDGLRRKE